MNVYNRKDVRDMLPGPVKRIVDGQLVPDTWVEEEWLPFLPSVGVSWEI